MAAIYQWFEGGILYQTWTTTLYPIEAIEALQISFDLSDGSMRPVLNEHIDVSVEFISGSKIQTLLTTGPYEEAVDVGVEFISGTKEVTLLTTGPYEEAVDVGVEFISGTKVSKLVVAFAPDEELQIDFDLDPSNCSMTPV
mgnify:CR=1 FL=1